MDETTEEHNSIKTYFDRVFEQFQFAINTIVLLEIMHYMVKRLGSELVKEKWKWFMSLDLLIDEITISCITSSFHELIKYTHTGIGGRDDSILASMKRMGEIKTLITHDSAFKKISEIQVIDPVEK
jgi:predicted nucleic acid-binding protein